MRRSYCLLSAAVLLALGVIGLAVPTREPAPPAVTEAPAARPPRRPPEPVEIVLKRGETLETALRRTGVERGDAAAIVAALRGSVNMRRLAPGERLSVQPGADGKPAAISYARSPAERYEIRPGPDGQWAVSAVRPDVDTRVVAITGERARLALREHGAARRELPPSPPGSSTSSSGTSTSRPTRCPATASASWWRSATWATSSWATATC